MTYICTKKMKVSNHNQQLTMAQIQKCIYNFKNWIKTAGLSEKKHQTDGIAWCLKREIEKLNGVRGGLVADEMGLGKTIETISLLCFIKEFKRKKGKFLIIFFIYISIF